MATPTRNALKQLVRKRLRDEQDDEDHSQDLFESVSRIIDSNFKSLAYRTMPVETEFNHVLLYLEIAMRTKHLDLNIGPIDTMRFVVGENMQYRFYFFSELLEEGLLTGPTDITNLTILQKMSDNTHSVCLGIPKYSQYKKLIRYDSKSLTHVELPTDTARHVNCEKLYQVPTSSVKSKTSSSMCKNCSSLKTYLTRLKNKVKCDTEDSSSHSLHQLSSSTFPLDYLSPNSVKARLLNVRRENKALNLKVLRLYRRSNHFLEVNDQQAKEVFQLVHGVVSSDTGQTEIEVILREAENVNEGSGAILRSIWEEDTSGLCGQQEFMVDQFTNGTNIHHIHKSQVHMYFDYNYTT